jgi:7-cyano-7-deazaguanine synthase
MQCVVLLSGGMDSTTLLAWTLAEGYSVRALSVAYGQRHAVELHAAREVARTYRVPWTTVACDSFAAIAQGSALTSDAVEVPDGHYSAPVMRLTVVPNRNMFLLSLAAAHALHHGAQALAYAAHAGDHAIYPDCRPAFVGAMRQALAVCDDPGLTLLTPFLHATKADIVRCGAALGVPYALTWSCYKGGERHCGTCGTCYERREAFTLAGVVDPTVYEGA